MARSGDHIEQGCHCIEWVPHYDNAFVRFESPVAYPFWEVRFDYPNRVVECAFAFHAKVSQTLVQGSAQVAVRPCVDLSELLEV